MNRLISLVLLFSLLLTATFAEAQTIFTRGVGKMISVTPTVTASTTNYTAGDCVGSKQTVSGIFPAIPGSGQGLFVGMADQGAEGKNIDVVIFHTNPSSSTFTDNGACTVADADLSKIACVVEIRSHYSFTDNGFSSGYTPGCLAVAGGTDVYAVAIAREGGYCYDATNALSFIYNAVMD